MAPSVAPLAEPCGRQVVIVIFVCPGPYGFNSPRPFSTRISSAILIGDRRTSSANGGSGRPERHDSAGMRPVTAVGRAPRRSTACAMRQAGQHRAWHPFQTPISRSASRSTWAWVARRAAASASALACLDLVGCHLEAYQRARAERGHDRDVGGITPAPSRCARCVGPRVVARLPAVHLK